METKPAAPDSAPEHEQQTAVRLEGVSFAYPPRRGGASVTALNDVTFTIAPHEIVAFVGPSGCGKSTLLDLVCGLRTPNGGALSVEPAVLMPQRDLLLPWIDALDNAALALRLHGASRAQARAEAAPTFAAFGLGGFEHSRPDELSGGMRQRVAFLRTLLSGKPVLCLDEPFGSLDALARAEMRAWLAATLAREPRTTVLVTHDVEEACVLADRVLVLTPRPGRIAATFEIALPRPRSATDPALITLRAQILEVLAG